VSGARRVRSVRAEERGWLSEHLQLAWRSATIVSRGRARDASRLPAVVCTDGDELLGLATFELAGGACELVTIEAFRPREGIGTALLSAVIEQARHHGANHLLLVTTNDNLAAQRFYEHHGLTLVATHKGAVAEARRRKPEIPLKSQDGTPIEDELEYRLPLA
jgi:ribosomal protein S18 acetylase RimI-like enzyme